MISILGQSGHGVIAAGGEGVARDETIKARKSRLLYVLLLNLMGSPMALHATDRATPPSFSNSPRAVLSHRSYTQTRNFVLCYNVSIILAVQTKQKCIAITDWNTNHSNEIFSSARTINSGCTVPYQLRPDIALLRYSIRRNQKQKAANSHCSHLKLIFGYLITAN